MLRNILCAFVGICAIITATLAQVPKYRFSKYDTTGVQTTSNDFSAANYAQRCQSIYYPTDIPLMPSGTIKTIYARIGNTKGSGVTSVIYSAFHVKIGYTSDSFFRYNGMNGWDTFKTGLTTVYGPVNFTVTGTDSLGKWLRIQLSTPFYYNKESKFVVEFAFGNISGSKLGAFDIMASNRAPLYSPSRNRNLVGHRDSAREYYGNANITLMDLGFDMTPNSVNELPPAFSSFGLFPNPTTDGRFNVSFETITSLDRASITVFNAVGQQVLHQEYELHDKRFFRELNLGSIARGMYSVRVEAGSESVNRSLIVR